MFLQVILYIFLCFIFPWKCGFKIDKTIIIPFALLISYSVLLYFGIFKYKKFLFFVKNLIKYTPIKFLIIFIAYLFIHGLLFATNNILNITFYIIKDWILYTLPLVLLTCYVFPRYISNKNLLKFIFKILYFIMIYGIIDFILSLHFNTFRCFIHAFFVGFTDSLDVNTQVFRGRTASIFFEPSFFATFIFLFLPFVYKISTSKIFYISSNKNLNFILKKGLIALTWINLFLTGSPIYLILCIIYTLLFFYKKIFYLIRKYILFILSLIILLSSVLFISYKNINMMNNKAISRINLVLSSNNIETLASVEESLATRIITTKCTYNAAQKHSFLGVGYRNTENAIRNEYLSAPVLTNEMISNNLVNNIYNSSPNIFWSLILEAGLLGLIIIYLFFLKTIFEIQKIKKYYIYSNRLLIECFQLIAINFIVIFFYWSMFSDMTIWLTFGLLNSHILAYKQSRKYLVIKKVNNELHV